MLIDSAALIATNLGVLILVDREDHHWLSEYDWFIGHSSHRSNYYACANVDGEMTFMHRMILGLNSGDELVSDHINGITLDNRRANLRAVTVQQNCWNLKRHKSNATGFKGVCFHRASGLYQARIYESGHRKSLGYFNTTEEAAIAYSHHYERIKKELFNASA